MKDSVEIVSSILGIVISCITIYQFFVQRPSVARLHREKTAHMSQELHPVPTGTEASAAMSPVSDEVEHAHTRKYLLALATFIVMPIVAFFLLYFYALWSQYSYSSQEALIANSGGALLAGSSLALMILLLAPSRQRAIVAEITFAIIYSLVLLGVILLNATIYFSFAILDSSLAGGNVLAVISASLVAFVIFRGTPPSRQQYIFGIIAFALIFLVTFSGPILYAHLLSEDVTERTLVGGSTMALIVASISFLTILLNGGTTRAYRVVLVIFAIVYFVILFLLEVIHSMTYNGLFYLFNEAGIGASPIAFVGGGLVAFLFLKSRGREG
ncbi:MAG TPA: hypothetical protein VF043_25075 [Ktedonobacteraceae bacterium]